MCDTQPIVCPLSNGTVYIVVAEPNEEEKDPCQIPTWEVEVFGNGDKVLIICMPKQAIHMTRLDMTKLLLWLPVVRAEMRAFHIAEDIVEDVCHAVLEIRRRVRVKLANVKAALPE